MKRYIFHLYTSNHIILAIKYEALLKHYILRLFLTPYINVMSEISLQSENKETLQYLQETQEYIYKLKENLKSKIIALQQTKKTVITSLAINKKNTAEASFN